MSNMHVGPFGKDDRRQCFNVNILNDTQSESSEYFVVIIQFCPGDQPERVDINPSSGNTTIIDDDGELLKTFVKGVNSKSVWSRAMKFQMSTNQKMYIILSESIQVKCIFQSKINFQLLTQSFM